MRLVHTRSIEPGSILGQTIYNGNGQVLIQKGVNLSERMLKRLLKQGITYVYIEDKHTEDIQIHSPIPNELRVEATKVLKETFDDLKNNGYMESAFILNKQNEALSNVVDHLMQELKHHDEALSLLADIFVTDDYIFQHSLNVTLYTLAIGMKLQLTDKNLTELGTGAMLHDVGKIFIDQEILQKPDQLTDKEFEIMKKHTEFGFDFLRKQATVSAVVAHCAYQHHERLDGSGYPRGLVGDEIHRYGKIIGVADVFDAVTSNRIYRDAMLPNEGLEILYAGAVDLFDKSMVEAFKNSVTAYPNGLSVDLSDGRNGVVAKQNKFIGDRPVIRILKENGEMVSNPYEVDLATVLNITITACHVS
ncbi:HD-GYP domain-containing protein [Oceanobacillus halotolerans]|uniref:HD-GYP domain-containing protein n=1 Tax=Oceanobacillus halotolerans TaxID=2663380 RepID=UPI0013DB6A2D|nr:HD-GYP domain-containing protein [Oceanobacillus halotolerans]